MSRYRFSNQDVVVEITDKYGVVTLGPKSCTVSDISSTPLGTGRYTFEAPERKVVVIVTDYSTTPIRGDVVSWEANFTMFEVINDKSKD